MILELEAPSEPNDVIAHFPLPAGGRIKTAMVNSQATAAPTGSTIRLEKVHGLVRIDVRF
jgi:hypothetical protein